jgi:hypothetical protein
MNTDHPTDWALRYVEARALRDAATDLLDAGYHLEVCDWLNARADELEQR